MHSTAAASTTAVARPVKHRSRPKILSHVALSIICFIVAFPMVFTIIKSTQNLGQIMAFPPNLLPGDQILSNYSEAWNSSNLVRLMSNTIIVAIGVTLSKTVTSMLRAWPLSTSAFPCAGRCLFSCC